MFKGQNLRSFLLFLMALVLAAIVHAGLQGATDAPQVAEKADWLFDPWTGKPVRWPHVGEIVDGYRFKGGDPNLDASWELVE